MPALRALLAAVVLSLGAAAVAQTTAYPQRPIKVLHGFSAGGAPDAVLRQVAVRLERALGTPVVVENRPGASGMIAAAAVARAEPDGYTLLFGVAANLAVAPAFAKPAQYDPVGTFAPIVEVARGPYVWLVRDDVPARTMTEFVQWARARPGQPNYASPGEGSVHHLATEMLKQAAGLDLVHVPVTTGLYLPLIGGQVDAMFDSMPSPLPHLASGKLRALAVTGPKRLAALPDVPTLAEQGIPGIDVNSWWGFVGPAGLPRDVVLRLNAEIRKALAEPELVAVLAKMAIEPTPGTPEAFAAYLAQEAARWKQVAAKARP